MSVVNYFREHPERILPTISVLIAIGASLAYIWKGDIRRTLYWAAAAVLTSSVTY